jgi:hypothetical protein
VNLLDIHFRSEQQFAFNGKTRTVANVDHCRCGDGLLTGYHRDGRLILRVALTSVDWFEVRESASLSFPRVWRARNPGHGHHRAKTRDPSRGSHARG